MKKNKKIRKKVLTKGNLCCIIAKLFRERRKHNRAELRTSKNFKKFLKKVLDNEVLVWYDE